MNNVWGKMQLISAAHRGMVHHEENLLDNPDRGREHGG